MTYKLIILDALCTDLSECGLESTYELTLHDGRKILFTIVAGYVAGYMLIEKKGIYDLEGVLAVSLDVNGKLHVEIGINDLERNGLRGSPLVLKDLLGVYEVNSLILAGVTAHRDPAAYGLESIEKVLTEFTVEK